MLGGICLKEKEVFSCQEEMDEVHHQLIEQIAFISVKEEEERVKEELMGNGEAEI